LENYEALSYIDTIWIDVQQRCPYVGRSRRNKAQTSRGAKVMAIEAGNRCISIVLKKRTQEEHNVEIRS
jgi:hypothetical protein